MDAPGYAQPRVGDTIGYERAVETACEQARGAGQVVHQAVTPDDGQLVVVGANGDCRDVDTVEHRPAIVQESLIDGGGIGLVQPDVESVHDDARRDILVAASQQVVTVPVDGIAGIQSGRKGRDGLTAVRGRGTFDLFGRVNRDGLILPFAPDVDQCHEPLEVGQQGGRGFAFDLHRASPLHQQNQVGDDEGIGPWCQGPLPLSGQTPPQALVRPVGMPKLGGHRHGLPLDAQGLQSQSNRLHARLSYPFRSSLQGLWKGGLPT